MVMKTGRTQRLTQNEGLLLLYPLHKDFEMYKEEALVAV